MVWGLNLNGNNKLSIRFESYDFWIYISSQVCHICICLILLVWHTCTWNKTTKINVVALNAFYPILVAFNSNSFIFPCENHIYMSRTNYLAFWMVTIIFNLVHILLVHQFAVYIILTSFLNLHSNIYNFKWQNITLYWYRLMPPVPWTIWGYGIKYTHEMKMHQITFPGRTY